MAQLTFFFDRCFGKTLPKLLGQITTPFVVEYHDDKKHGFRQETQDDDWLAVVGRKRWIVLSHDKRFHADSAAVRAVTQHKIGCFYLDGATYPVWDKLRLFARSYERVRTIINTEKAPYIYRIRHTHRITRVL